MTFFSHHLLHGHISYIYHQLPFLPHLRGVHLTNSPIFASYEYKLPTKNFFVALGVYLHPLYPLATPTPLKQQKSLCLTRDVQKSRCALTRRAAVLIICSKCDVANMNCNY